MSEISRNYSRPTQTQIDNGWAWCDCGWEGYPVMKDGNWVCPDCYGEYLADIAARFYSEGQP
jgi:hypothetical protein